MTEHAAPTPGPQAPTPASPANPGIPTPTPAPPAGPADQSREIDAALQALREVDEADLDGRQQAGERLHTLLSARLAAPGGS